MKKFLKGLKVGGKMENQMDTKKQFDVFIKGELIDLVVLDEEVVAKTNWYNWFNDEEITKYMVKHYYPNTRAMQLGFFKKEIENNPNKLQLGIFHKKDKVLVGIVSLSDIDFFNRQCEIAGLIGEKKYQNFRNYIEACKLLIVHAFNILNMHRIYGGTIIKEVEEMFCRVLGFTHEGIKRKSVYKNGKYHDAYLIGLLKEEYIQKRKLKE